jgi:hypothetical protein
VRSNADRRFRPENNENIHLANHSIREDVRSTFFKSHFSSRTLDSRWTVQIWWLYGPSQRCVDNKSPGSPERRGRQLVRLVRAQRHTVDQHSLYRQRAWHPTRKTLAQKHPHRFHLSLPQMKCCDRLAHITNYIFAQGYLPCRAGSMVSWKGACEKHIEESVKVEDVLSWGEGVCEEKPHRLVIGKCTQLSPQRPFFS